MLFKSDIELAYQLQQNILQKKPGRRVTRARSTQMDLNNGFIQVISGIRRCGKSTLLHQLMGHYSQKAYFNFEDPRVAAFEVRDFDKLDTIIPKDTEAFFFDEIQNVSQWERYARNLHDRGKKVFITGSNASLLSKELGTRLTGRYLNAELFPFSYLEYLLFNNKRKSVATFKEYLQEGGFPEFINTKNPEVPQNLLKDIILRDIAIRYGIRNTSVILEIALFLISNIGKETTYNSLRKAFKIGSANTVIDYLTWMEDAYLLFFLQRFSWSAKSRAVNPRKVYAIDTGFVKANSLSFTSDSGRLFENAVYIHMRAKGAQMYYFKESGECDFVLFKEGHCQLALQVCYELNLDNRERELAGLLEAMIFFNLETGYILTVSHRDEMVVENKKIIIMPAHEFFTHDSL